MTQMFVPRGDCRDVRAGDTVVRLLANALPMELRVRVVAHEFFECEVPGMPNEQGWLFERATGVEFDDRPEIRSGTRFGRSMSIIVRRAEAT